MLSTTVAASVICDVDLMAFEIARMITLPTVALGSAVLVARYRALGAPLPDTDE